MKLNIGPGATHTYFKSSKDWELIDCERSRVKSNDMVIDFNNFKKIPRSSQTFEFVYASHVLEHIPPYYTIAFLKEVYRIMKKDSIFRIIVPDAKKSIEKYLKGESFKLFERRKSRYQKYHSKDNNYVPMTEFEAMQQCFMSVSRQKTLLKNKEYRPFAHQNAWDFDSLCADLQRSGFKKDNVFPSSYGKSLFGDISFEKKLKTEAREHDRSMYVEVKK